MCNYKLMRAQGLVCTAKCNNSRAILYRQEKARKLRDCVCDGTEEYNCPALAKATDKLCFQHPPSASPISPVSPVRAKLPHHKHRHHHDNAENNNNNDESDTATDGDTMDAIATATTAAKRRKIVTPVVVATVADKKSSHKQHLGSSSSSSSKFPHHKTPVLPSLVTSSSDFDVIDNDMGQPRPSHQQSRGRMTSWQRHHSRSEQYDVSLVHDDMHAFGMCPAHPPDTVGSRSSAAPPSAVIGWLLSRGYGAVVALFGLQQLLLLLLL